MKNGEKNRHSLSRKSIRGLILLGVVILLTVSAASGVTLYREQMNLHSKMAVSYSYLYLSQIDAEKLAAVIDADEDFGPLWDECMAIFSSDSHDASLGYYLTEEEEQQLREKYKNFDELKGLLLAYSDLSSSVFVGGNLLEGVSGFSIVVPDEDGYTCIIDSDLADPHDYRERVAYSGPNEKELILDAWHEQTRTDMDIYREGNRVIGKVAYPVYDVEGETPIAVQLLEVPVTRIRIAFLRLIAVLTILILIIMAASVLGYYYFMRKNIISPVEKLNRAALELVPGLKEDKHLRVDVHSRDEMDTLARSFEEMDDMLRKYISENAAITSEKERIGVELSLASRIQTSMLPDDFPAFPDRHDFDIYATMKPAREVGGDFYDFFLLDETHLALVMADVSGKGIPAALFMMVSKIMLQNFLMTGMRPKEALAAVNDRLSRSNRAEMFVTIWLGILDLTSGLLTAANAGHEFPVRKEPGEPFELLKDKHGFVVGGMEGIAYNEYELQLAKGTALFIYTDGLPEAQNKEGTFFGMDRVLKALNEGTDPGAASDPRDVLQVVQRAVDDFVGEEPPFDDLTMLCMVYYGS